MDVVASRRLASKTSPNPPTRMVSIALMSMLYKQFGDMTSELMSKQIDMVSNARQNIYTRNYALGM